MTLLEAAKAGLLELTDSFSAPGTWESNVKALEEAITATEESQAKCDHIIGCWTRWDEYTEVTASMGMEWVEQEIKDQQETCDDLNIGKGPRDHLYKPSGRYTAFDFCRICGAQLLRCITIPL